MPKKPIAAANRADEEIKAILLGMRFGGAVPDKAAPVYYTLTFLAKAIRKPMSWVKKTINESLPEDQRQESQIKDWGTLDRPFIEKLETQRLRPMAIEAASDSGFLRQNVSLSIAERAELLNTVEPKAKISRYILAKAYKKAGIKKKRIKLQKYFSPHLVRQHIEMEAKAAKALYIHLR